MTPRTARRLLVLTGTALAGYSVGWFGRAWGWTPLIVLAAVSVAAWAAGYMRAWTAHADETAAAKREVGRYNDHSRCRSTCVAVPPPPSLTSVPKQAER